ncbi:MAG: VCBS repeat-containing protein [Candidatus Hydrogenedentota bacterium]
MRTMFTVIFASIVMSALQAVTEPIPDSNLERVRYNNPGLTVDLGVGLWAQPMPVDYDNDGDVDLLVATADVPSNGIYFFENPGGDSEWPVFKPGVRISGASHNTTISYSESGYRMTINGEFPEYTDDLVTLGGRINYMGPRPRDTRTRQWKFTDFDGDGVTDLYLGVGDWTEYGWDDAYDSEGVWQQGPLHGHIYVIRNEGSDDAPKYATAIKLRAGGQVIDVYGCPSPNFVDMDDDGDLDLIAGEFLDRISYFENVGTREKPLYRKGRFLTHKREIIHQDLQMLQVVVFDWNKDGKPDIVVGKEDGRVALMLNTGKFSNGVPQFTLPRYLQQEAEYVKIGALCTPFSVDWDGDGDEDLISGDTAGYINFVENLDGGNPPRWAKPVYLEADGETIRIQAGVNGSIQGPAEAKWGYTTLNVADWDHDGLLDIVINSIWGKVQWFRNVGTQKKPVLESARPIEVEWDGPTPKPSWNWWSPEGKELVTQWRTTPVVHDLNKDGLKDLVMLDHEGFLAFYERRKDGETLSLLPPERIFLNDDRTPLRLNNRDAGKSGRRKWAFTDWDGDSRLDILINGTNITFLRNVGTDNENYIFRSKGNVDEHKLAGHTTSPTTVDWDGDGDRDLLIGAEDGFLYYLKNPH